MATKIRPIVFRINEPEGFVMNAANAQYYTSGNWTYLYWNGPSFPNGYEGNGKQCIIVNNGNLPQSSLEYMSDNLPNGGPPAIDRSDLVTGTITMDTNLAPVAEGYGKYLGIPFSTEEAARAWVANVSITILDP